jgi:hypothetical protein
MLPFGVTIPATVPQRSEIPEGLINYPVLFCSCFLLKGNFVLIWTEFLFLKIVWILAADVQVLREKSVCRLQGFVGNLKHPFAYLLIHSL